MAEWSADFYNNFIVSWSTPPTRSDFIYVNFHLSDQRVKHWVLVSIDVKSENYTIFDSERFTDLNFVKKCIDYLIDFLFAKRGWKSNLNMTWQQPSSARHCGVYSGIHLLRG